MNRRLFLASLPFLPSAVKAALAELAPYPHYSAYHADARGIHALLKDCGKCVEPAPLDLDALFDQIYALKSRRNSQPPNLFVHNSHGCLIQIA